MYPPSILARKCSCFDSSCNFNFHSRSSFNSPRRYYLPKSHILFIYLLNYLFLDRFIYYILSATDNEAVSIVWCHSFVINSTHGWVPGHMGYKVEFETGTFRSWMERLTSLHITRVHILSIQIIHNSFRLKNTFNRRLSIKLTITTPFLASPLFLQNIPKSDNSPNFWTEPCPPPPFQQTSRFANLPLDF